MKPDNIQRGIRARRGGRSPGDAPSLGRLGRMPEGEKKSRWMGDKRRFRSIKAVRLITIGWSLGLALLALALVSGTFAWWIVSRAHAPRQVQAAAPLLREVEALVEQELVLTRPYPEEIVRLATGALEVDSEATVDEFIHTGGRDWQEVVAFMQGLSQTDGIPGEPVPLLDPDVNGLMIQNVLIKFDHPDFKERNRIMILTPDEAGAWKVDFPAFARLADPPWEDFVSGEAKSVVGRVFVLRDNYYNGPFSNERRWAAFAIASPDLDDLMIGYCPVGSPTQRALSRICAKQRGPVRATLRIRHVDGAERRQFAIDKVLAEDWVVRGADFEDRFQ
jgi:hypothetical protein